MKTEAEEYFEMATANTKKTRPTVCADECLALMKDFAQEHIEKELDALDAWLWNSKYQMNHSIIKLYTEWKETTKK